MKKNNRWILRAFFCIIFVFSLFLFIRPDQKDSVGGLEPEASEQSDQRTALLPAEPEQLQESAEPGLQQGAASPEAGLQQETAVPSENSQAVVESSAPEAVDSDLPFSEELFAAFLQDERVEPDLRDQVLWYAYEKELAQWVGNGSEEQGKPAPVPYPQTVFMNYSDDYVLFEMEFANREELVNIGDKLPTIGAELRFASKIVPYAIGGIHHDDLYRVAALAEVRRFIPNYRTVVSAEPDTPYSLNGLPTADAMGYRGSGILIGIMDTGFRLDHEYYKGDMIELGSNFGTDVSTWTDSIGHGTSVAGVFALSGTWNSSWKGMTLDAQLRIAKVAQGSGEDAVVLGSSVQAEAVEWLLDPNDDGNYDDSVDIITSSVGMLGITSTVLSALVEDITQNNRAIFVVAAGNCGDVPAANCEGYQGMMSPANVRTAISVGNIQQDYFLNSSSSYKALTDTSGDYTKPDVVSFGTDLISIGVSSTTAVVSLNGTSFSAPSVAAIIAIILQIANDLGLDYTHLEIKELLEKTASKPLLPVYDTVPYGNGLVNLQSVSEYMMSSQCLLIFDVTPSELKDSAMWRTTSMAEWVSVTASVKLTPGNYTVIYDDIPGYMSPGPVSLRIRNQESEDLFPVWSAIPTAPLTVSCMPLNAATNAQWKISGEEWVACNSTVQLTPGTYLLEFGPLAGYVTPDAREVGVAPESGAQYFATWQSSIGWLRPSVGPSAVSSFASLRETETESWFPFLGEYMLSGGEHCFEFSSVSTYVTPSTTCVDITAQTTTELFIFYEQEMGDLLVNLFPADLPGSAWRIFGSGNWLSSGSRVSTACVTQMVEFQSVSYYDTPPGTSVLPLYQQTVELSGVYVPQNAPLSVWCTPSADAQWKISGGDWRVCNSVVPMLPGTYQLEFNSLDGYNSPVNSVVSVVPSTGTSFYAVWHPSVGWLRPSAAPLDISTQVSLRQTDTSTWLDFSGEYLLTEGNHCFEFSSLSSYVTPTTTCVAITDQTTTDLLVFYERETGGLRVNLFPAELTESAWRLVPTTEWLASGSTVYVTCETRMLEFKSVSYYDTPAETSVLPLYQQTVFLSAEYLSRPAELTVFLEPPAAVADGGGWRLYGHLPFYGSGEAIGLNAGDYLVDFLPVPGYRVPEPLSVSLSLEQQLSVTVVYQAGSVNYSGNYTTFPMSGGQRCSAESFAHVPAMIPMTDAPDYRGHIADLQMSGQDGVNMISFRGVAAEDDNLSDLADGYFFPLVYRCAENSDQEPVWERIELWDESGLSVQNGQVYYQAAADISEADTRQLRDPAAVYQDEYWYLVLSVFSDYNGDLKTAYEQAVANFERNDERADRRPQNWSNFLLTRFYPSFDFSAQNRTDEARVLSGSLVEPNNFLPAWIQSTDISRPDFTHYSFALSGARAVDGSLLSTADMSIRSFTRVHDGVPDSLLSDPGFNADGGRAISAYGLKLATAINGLSALLSVAETSALLTNDIFLVEIEAGSQLSFPQTTALTMIFIVQEAAKPLLISSSLLQQGSDGWQAFDWQMSVPLASGGGLPWPAQVSARYVAEFSEQVSSAVLRLDVVAGEQGGDGLPMFANQSQDVQGVDTSFYADISTERFGELLGDGSYMDIIPLVSGATDNQNVVPANRNIMQADGQGRFHIVTTPYVTGALTGSPETPLSRNGTISLHFSSPVTTPLWWLRQGLQVDGLADFSLRKAEDNRVLLLEPLAGAEMVMPGTDTGSILLHRGYALNSSSFPMITTWTGTVYFSPDLTPPLLTAHSLQGNPSMTAVSGYLQFNEPLLSNAEYPRLYLSGATVQELTKELDFLVAEAQIRFVLSDLDMEQEFSLRAVLSDAAGNVSSYTLPSFITLNPDSDTMVSDRELVEQINALETPPYIVGISPDFQLQSNRANVSPHPLFFVEFSRNMQASVTEAVVLTTEGSVVPVRLDFFREYKMQFLPENDLLPDTDYMLSFAVDKAVDSGGRALSPAPVFNFRTESEPSGLVETVTEFLQYTGNNLSSLMETGLVPRFYFDRPVDVRSLASAVEFRDADGASVSGFWNIEGGDALFSGADFLPGSSYSCTVYTSRITDLSGLRIQGNIPQPPVLFTVLSELEIRNFRVLVEPVAETLYVTASWLPSLDKTDISTYYFGYYELIALSEPEPGAEPVWLAELPHSDSRASFGSSTQISPFVQGNSYRFVLSAAGASGVETRVFANVLSVSPVEILSRAPFFLEQQLQMGDAQENGADLSLKPQQTLRESETFSVSVVENENLKQMRGGGERYAKMMQLGPAGLKFVQPVILGLKFSTPAYQTFADLSPQCTLLDMACEQALFELLYPLVLDFSRQQWTTKGLGKKRVEILDETNAIMYAIVPHFSIYTVAASLSIVSPADNALLSTVRTDSTAYSALISLNRGATAQDVSVSFLPADSNLSYRLVPDGTSIEIYLNGAVFQPPADYSSEIAVTVAVTDVGSSQTDSRSYRIPVDYMDGDRDYAGYPRNVDMFAIRQPDENTVEAEWNIDSDTDRQIHKFVLSYRQIWPQSSSATVLLLERVTRSFSFPVSAGEQWELIMATESYQGIRSRTVNNQIRRTWGHAENPVTASGPVAPGGDWLINGRRVDNFRFTLKSGEEARFFKYTAEDISTLQSSGLLFSAANTLSNGVVFFPETLFDINFSATTEAELEYTVNRTGDQYAVYHFGGSSWRRLTGTGSLQAEIQENGQSSLVRIKSSDGAGSPLVMGVESAAVPVWTTDSLDGGSGGGGGGGCSVGTIDDEVDWQTGFLNLLLMLCPLGWLILRYLYRN